MKITTFPNYRSIELWSQSASAWCARQERASDLDQAIREMSDEELETLLAQQAMERMP